MTEESTKSLVFVVKAGELYNIGTTTNLKRRLKQLAETSPVQVYLVGYCVGDRKRKGALHREFAEWCSHGEWFALPPDQVTTLQRRLEGEPRLIQLPKAGKRAMLPPKKNRTKNWRSRPRH